MPLLQLQPPGFCLVTPPPPHTHTPDFSLRWTTPGPVDVFSQQEKAEEDKVFLTPVANEEEACCDQRRSTFPTL